LTTRTSPWLGIALLGLLLATPALADDAPTAAEIGKKLANPVSDVWALFTEFDFIWNDGSLNTRDARRVSSQTLFQPVLPIKLTENSKLITRPALPIIWSQPTPRGTSRGIEFERESSLGDMALPLLYSPNEPIDALGGQIAWGLGPTFVFPTATNTLFQSNQFQAGPGGIFVFKTEKTTSGVFPQYWWSFASTRSGAANTAQGSLLYFFWYDLPDAWQIGTAPTITYNHYADGGDRWNVPIGLMLAKTTKVGPMPVKFQFGAEYSVFRQNDYGKRFQIRLNIIPVIKPLITKPLF